MSSYDVFISYNHQSKDLAKKIYDSLKKSGYDVFWDNASSLLGESIPRVTREALESSTHILCLITQAWIDSDYCNLELDTTIMNDPSTKARKLIPLLVEKNVEIPNDIKRIKYIDFSSWATNYRSLMVTLRRSLKKSNLKAIIAKQESTLRNMSILPWTPLKSASFDFLLPDLFVQPNIKAIKHQYTGSFENFFTKAKINKNLALLGIPGNGKTTLLKKIFISSQNSANPILYFTAKELLSVSMADISLVAIIKVIYETDVSRELNEYDNITLLIDGVDEIDSDKTNDLFKILEVFSKNSVSFIIALRTDFYLRYIVPDATKTTLFFDIIELTDWTPEQGIDFIEKFSDKATKPPYLLDGIKQLVKNNEKIQYFLTNPFKVSLMVFLLDDESYDSSKIIANDYTLYKEFYSHWIQQEKNKGTSSNDLSMIIKYHTKLAISLYTNRSSVSLESVIPESEINKFDILSDSAFIGLLLCHERFGKTIVEKFYHETLAEFIVAEGIVQSFLSGNEILNYMKITYNNEVNVFIRNAFEILGKNDLNTIMCNLNKTYKYVWEELPDNEANQRIREQIIYFIGRAPLSEFPEILIYAYTNEKNSILRRAAALSLIILGDEAIERDYIGKIEVGSAFDIENRSIQLVYFGDVHEDFHTYRDAGLVQWNRTKDAIIKRLSEASRRNINLRLWDIVTLRMFCVNRGCEILSPNDIKIINDTIITGNGISEQRQEYLNSEKQLLLNLINNE